MVQVMLRLQNHGKKNRPYWWIVVQPKNKHFQGRILEKVGVWSPRRTKTVDRAISINRYKIKYWLSVGATPTDSVHRLLYFSGLLPKKPVPFGSKYAYEPKKKTYSMQFFHTHRWGLNVEDSANLHYYSKIKEMESLLDSRIRLESDALAEMVRPRDINFNEKKTEYKTDMNTDDINSDDFDFYKRKRNFDIVSKKLNKYFENDYKLYRGNDYKYYNYLRKLEKLSKFGSLDSEGFKDYLENLNNLSSVKNKNLEFLENLYKNEISKKNSFKIQLEEIIKFAKEDIEKQGDNFDYKQLFYTEEELSSKNDSEQTSNDISSIFLKSLDSDGKFIVDTLAESFKSAARGIFNLHQDETFTDPEFQHIKNLRAAKILIKLRVALLNQERNMIIENEERIKSEESDIYKNQTFSQKFEKLNKHYKKEKGFPSINNLQDNFNNSNYSDIPLFDKELIDEILERHSMCEDYDDSLFQNLNNYYLNTSTFQKFKPLLFHPEFYGYSNIEEEMPNEYNREKNDTKKIYKYRKDNVSQLENPNIYLINNELIDQLIFSFIDKLKKKYEVNDIYRDEEADLESFQNEELIRSERRSDMQEKLVQLSEKYQGINLLYDKLPESSKNEYRDIYEFREKYGKELDEKYDVKFKKDLRIVKPEIKLRRYFTQEEVDNLKAEEEKADKIVEKINKEIEAIRLGKPIPNSEPVENEEDKKLEQIIRDKMMYEAFNTDDLLHKSILPNTENLEIDFSPFFKFFKRLHKKSPKTKFQDDMLKYNKIYNRKNLIIANSYQETKSIPIPRQREIAKRFKELFGVYSNILYPEGFRHLENYEVYSQIYPEKSIGEYQTECKFIYMKLILILENLK